MGSGETTTGMLGVHREVFSGLADPTDARLMDSPFAFQENADELVEKINQYFTESLGHPLRAVTLPAGADALTVERALADIRAADWVFAGPGSPSYARRCWEGTGVPEALAGVVAPGRSGALVFASAAVVTLGDWALPVYEIYKVGEDPRWESGIGLMSQILGWRCAVIPHYDNREGGTHDTRFCYVGGRRLAQIEPDLGDGFILGVDEHTALVLDLDAGTAWVAGRSAVTLRVAGVEDVVPNGSRLTIAELEDRIAALGAGAAVGRETGSSGSGTDAGAESGLDPSTEDAAAPDADRPVDADATWTPPISRAPSSRYSQPPRQTSARPWSLSSIRPRPPRRPTTGNWRAGPSRRWWTCARTAGLRATGRQATDFATCWPQSAWRCATVAKGRHGSGCDTRADRPGGVG